MSMTVTNVDLGNVILQDAKFRDELLTFAAGGTVVEGTILARDSVSGKLVPFVITGTPTNENNVPKAILTYDVTATAAGDVAIRAGVAGGFRKERLVVDADGDDSNITDAILDQLRDYGLVPVDVAELGILDNQ